MSASSTAWKLVTGQPGCGKTTAVKKIVSKLQEHGFECRGFVTEEVRQAGDGGSRIGFDVVTVPTQERAVLARKGGPPSWPKTGQYSVDVESFEKLALSSLDASSNHIVYVVDEIGRMELHSEKFQECIRTLLDRGVRLVGAITAPIYGHRVAFCDEIASQNGVQVHKLTKETRDAVTEELIEELLEQWIVK